MSDAFRKVQSGDQLRVPAETFNTLIDVARDYKQRRQDRAAAGTPYARQSGLVRIRNDSGADRNRFDILGLFSPIIEPADNPTAFEQEPTFVGSTPQLPGKFAVLLEPVANGQIARYACVAGVCVVRVLVRALWHERADVLPSETWALESAEWGSAAILWKEAGLGLRWAIVRLGDSEVAGFWARLGAATRVGANRWSYPFTEVVKQDGGGYGQWTDKLGGRSGVAYNSIEDPNDGYDQEGNGVDVGQRQDQLLPAGHGAVVRLHEVARDNVTARFVEYWFQFENAWEEGSDSSGSFPDSWSSSESGAPSASDSGASGGSSSDPSSSSDSSDPPPGSTIDVVVCDPYRVGDEICFPQKRIHLPPGSWVEDIAATYVYVCCDDSSAASSDSDSDSGGSASDGSGVSAPSGSSDIGPGGSGSGASSSSGSLSAVLGEGGLP